MSKNVDYNQDTKRNSRSHGKKEIKDTPSNMQNDFGLKKLKEIMKPTKGEEEKKVRQKR